MRYSEIQHTIKVYPSNDQQWMMECLEVAKKEHVRFLTFAAFLEWTGYNPKEKHHPPRLKGGVLEQ